MNLAFLQGMRREGSDLPPLATNPGDTEQNLYRDTLREGKAPSNCISVIVVGNENAGKSTLIERLITLDDPSARIDNSYTTTSCMVNPVKKTRTWEVVKNDFLEALNIQRMSQAMENVREKQQTKKRNQKENVDNIPVHEIDADDIYLGSDCIDDREPTRTFDYEAAAVSVERYNYLTQVVARINQSKQPTMFFTYREYGGLDTNALSYQVFLPPRAVYLLVVDLSLDFDKTMSTSMKEDKRNSKCLLKEYTVLEMIQFWTSSIKKRAEETADNRSAPMILVVTRKDKLSSAHANIKIGQIRETMLMFGVEDLDVILLDTKRGHVNELEKLRNHIFDKSRAFSEEYIPAHWIALEHKLVLLKQLKSTCSIGDFYKMVLQYDVPVTDKSEIIRFLDFEQQSGQLIYIDTGTENCPILLNPMAFTLYMRTLWKMGQNGLNLIQNGILRLSAVEKAHAIVEEHINASCNIDAVLDLFEHLNIMKRVSISDQEQGILLPSLLKLTSPETKTEYITEKAPTIQIQFQEWHTHPTVYYTFLFSLFEYLECTRRTEYSYLFSRIFLNGETVYCEIRWMQLAIYIYLKNISRTKRITDMNCRDFLSAVKNVVRDSLHQHSQEINIECDQHEMRFVRLDALEEEGEAKCETGLHLHAVSSTAMGVYRSTTGIQSIHQAPQFRTVQTRTPDGRPSDKDLGRLARRLIRENVLGFARLLGRKKPIEEADRIHNDFKTEAEGRMELLRLWRQSNPRGTVTDLERILTKSYNSDYIFRMLNSEVITYYSGHETSLLDAAPSDASLSTVCECMLDNYPFVFLELGLSWHKIKSSQQKYPNDFHRLLHYLFVKWRRKFPRHATLRLLLNTLRSFDCDTDTVLDTIRRDICPM